MKNVYMLYGKNSKLEVEVGKYGGEVLGYFSSYEKANAKAQRTKSGWN
ncbi:hypothetical protein GAG94_01960 [Lysinibacillus sphaericus]|nr:hypothetical protein GAG94_01960 [Lysinibacillus sphaericus]